MATNTRTKNSILNMSSLLILQLVSVVSGLILPRLMISSFGSEANGLVSSIAQFLSYITLLEAGVAGVVRTALYKPLAERNFNKVSGIVKASKQFYSKLTFYFVVYVLGLCVVYPLITNTAFDLTYVVTMIIILSISNVFEYLVGYTNSILIKADQKARIIDVISTIALIINVAVVYLLIYFGCSIHVVKLATCIIFATKPIFYWLYVKTRYKLNNSALADNSALSQKKNGMAHNLAYFFHSNTDVFLITLLMTATDVSVYVVYFAIVSGIEKVATSFSQGSTASIGNLITKENDNDKSLFFDKFEFIQWAFITILFTITAIMIIPFVKLYSETFIDANYILPTFGYVLVVAEATYCIRCIYSTVSTSANKFKETQNAAIFEAVINFAVSFALIYWLGLLGVAIGTLCGMLFRACFEIWYMSKHVIKRPIYKTVKILFISVFIAGCSILICHFIPEFSIGGWLNWVARAFTSAGITIAIAVTVYSIFYGKIIKELLLKFKRKKKGN